MQRKLYRLWNVRDEQLVLPEGKWMRFDQLPNLQKQEAILRTEVLDRLSRFGMAFNPEHWDTVSVNPFMKGNDIVYWGVYGETVVVEGQFYVNDVIDGDHCYVSVSDSPFWCLHRGSFETNDSELYQKFLKQGAGLADKDNPSIVTDPMRLAKAAALYIIRKSGPGELTLEANRETGQRLIIGPKCKTAIYEYWDTGLSEPLTTTKLGSIDAVADFLVNHRFVAITDDYRIDGALAERIIDYLSKEKPEATIIDLIRLVQKNKLKPT